MIVTAVIPTLANEKTKPYLKICVESLRATVDWDIIAVSNGAPVPESTAGIMGMTSRLHTRDQGQCVATNIGVRVSSPRTEYVMVTNDDMYYAPGWNTYLRYDYPCFSPNLVEPTNNNGSAKPFMKVDGGFTTDEFNKELVDDFVRNTIHKVHHEEETVEDGFNLPFFIRKDVWDTIGGYDEAYDPWGSNSDTDLQTKINLAGITPVRLRDVLVYHFSNKSDTFTPDKQAYWQQNWDYYTDKWGFNRDQLNSDVWYNKNMLPTDHESIKYKPEWAGRFQ